MTFRVLLWLSEYFYDFQSTFVTFRVFIRLSEYLRDNYGNNVHLIGLTDAATEGTYIPFTRETGYTWTN